MFDKFRTISQDDLSRNYEAVLPSSTGPINYFLSRMKRRIYSRCKKKHTQFPFYTKYLQGFYWRKYFAFSPFIYDEFILGSTSVIQMSLENDYPEKLEIQEMVCQAIFFFF